MGELGIYADISKAAIGTARRLNASHIHFDDSRRRPAALRYASQLSGSGHFSLVYDYKHGARYSLLT